MSDVRARRRQASLRARITLAAAAVVALTLIGASFALVTLLRGNLIRSVSGEAKLRAAEIAALSADGPLPVPLPVLVAPWPTLVQVVRLDGTPVTSSTELSGRAPLVEVDAGDREVVVDVSEPLGRGSSHWRVESTPATANGVAVDVIVATSISQFDRTTRVLEVYLLIGIPLLVAFVTALAWTIAGRALRPVERLRLQLAGASGAGGGGRLPEGTDDELGRLATALNEVLARLESSSAAQNQFVADASHELRSPLANIRVALEVARAHPDRADWPAVIDDVLAQDTRMQVLVDDLLLLAEGDQRDARRWTDRVDLADVVAEVVAASAFDHAPIRVDGLRHAVVTGGRPELVRVVTNLLDNAVRFARHHVTVSVAGVGRWAELVVTDDGPGIPTGERERVFERFVRLDEHRSRPGGGAGLGLAIVKQIVVAHGGAVSIGDTTRGATLVVRLPVAGDGSNVGGS